MKRKMRNCNYKIALLTLLAANFAVFFLMFVLWPAGPDSEDRSMPPPGMMQFSASKILDAVTFILIDFEEFMNDVRHTVSNISVRYPSCSILVASRRIPYPPLNLPAFTNIRLVTADHFPGHPVAESRLENFIQSEYVVFIPDGVRPAAGASIKYMISFLRRVSTVDETVTIAAWSITTDVRCLHLNVDLRSWTLNYTERTTAREKLDYITCDALDHAKFVLLISKKALLRFSFPFLRPIHSTIFIQNVLQHGGKVAVDLQAHETGRGWIEVQELKQNQDAHTGWKQKRNTDAHLKTAYKQLGVKLVRVIIRANDNRTLVSHQWHGCTRETERCFGTVINDVPEYIYAGRWTPPCCLQALRRTAQHVFKTLTSQKVRFWLEGGSLLGAARSGDIIPWDYDVDIGIYRDDILKSNELLAASLLDRGAAHEDDDGFMWERATEGDFFRVQYSKTNRLHVDIFPFYSRNGTMTKNTWFASHRQDTNFSESFLLPLTTISFAGFEASAPNNIRKFLEYKFGRGVIENPRYPDSKLVL